MCKQIIITVSINPKDCSIKRCNGLSSKIYDTEEDLI